MSSVLSLVRNRTAEAHRRLDASIAIETQLNDLERYRHLLESFFGFYLPLERSLGEVVGDDVLAARKRSAWLRADLAQLGHTEASLDRIPLCARLPDVEGLARSMGCRYVIEGSSLGGRQILAMMKGRAVPSSARCFFTGYGEATGEHWRHFCQAFEDFGWNETELDELAAAADETFVCLQLWMDPERPQSVP